MGKRLTSQQRKFYEDNGYMLGLPPVLNPTQVQELNTGLEELMKLLKPGEDSKEIREWHESSRFLYDICMNDTILDYVEDILGPDFYLWGSNFFIKPPRSNSTVGWHQDTYNWPLEPKISATVWLALEDVDEQNAAMKVIPGSHKAGLLKHSRSSDTDSVLTLECEGGQFREDAAVSFNLKAGQISIHDDKLVHGSPANHSDRRRAGLTIRYSSTIVKCDLSVNPHHHLNPLSIQTVNQVIVSDHVPIVYALQNHNPPNLHRVQFRNKSVHDGMGLKSCREPV